MNDGFATQSCHQIRRLVLAFGETRASWRVPGAGHIGAVEVLDDIRKVVEDKQTRDYAIRMARERRERGEKLHDLFSGKRSRENL